MAVATGGAAPSPADGDARRYAADHQARRAPRAGARSQSRRSAARARYAGLGGAWLPGAGRFEFPALDPNAVRLWLDRGNLGRSFHIVLAYDPDGSGERIARIVQGEWAGHSIYVEPRPLRGRALEEEALTGRSHGLLVEAQALLDRPEADLAVVVMPLRGPAVGSFRTGWRTREFDPWILAAPGAPPLDPSTAQRRLEEERVVLPIAELPWLWVVREGDSGVAFHPGFGPQCASLTPAP
jgi:hypothetical protein